MNRMKRTFLAVALAVLSVSASVSAQGVVVGEKATVTASIHSINFKTREVTLKTDDGKTTTLVAGEEIKRFNDLKVNDRVTFHYLAAVIFELKPADKPLAAPVHKEATVRKTAGSPGAVSTIEVMAVVAVESVDTAHSSITVKTHDGTTGVFRVEDKANLEKVKAGDKIEITYTEALAIAVETPTKPAEAKPADVKPDGMPATTKGK